MENRKLGRSGIEVTPLALGCWAIGGPTMAPIFSGSPHFGWGEVDDAESIRAIHAGLELGVRLFDTADIYGCGHSERILGRALAGRRQEAVLATKFGLVGDEHTRRMTGHDASPEYICRAVEGSLRRLGTDYIDLYQFHIGDYDPDFADFVQYTLEKLVAAGKIRAYGWSTDLPGRAALWAGGKGYAAVQFESNVLQFNAAMLPLLDEHDLTGLIRGPLGMGLLTGKFTSAPTFGSDDIRHRMPSRFAPERVKRTQALREVLTQGGRTLAQGAIAWLWARHPRLIPITGFRNVAQVTENAGALRFGPLSPSQMAEVDELLADPK